MFPGTLLDPSQSHEGVSRKILSNPRRRPPVDVIFFNLGICPAGLQTRVMTWTDAPPSRGDVEASTLRTEVDVGVARRHFTVLRVLVEDR